VSFATSLHENCYINWHFTYLHHLLLVLWYFCPIVYHRCPGQTAILPPHKVVRCLMTSYHPHFCRYHPYLCGHHPIFCPSWVPAGAVHLLVPLVATPLHDCPSWVPAGAVHLLVPLVATPLHDCPTCIVCMAFLYLSDGARGLGDCSRMSQAKRFERGGQ